MTITVIAAFAVDASGVAVAVYEEVTQTNQYLMTAEIDEYLDYLYKRTGWL